METEYRILRPHKPDPEVRSCDLPRDPGYDRLKVIIEPVLQEDRPTAHLEHVSVLFDGKPTDMFVDDCGALEGLPVNAQATRIYHAFSISQGIAHEGGIIPGAPLIFGTAIIFDRRVWF